MLGSSITASTFVGLNPHKEYRHRRRDILVWFYIERSDAQGGEGKGEPSRTLTAVSFTDGSFRAERLAVGGCQTKPKKSVTFLVSLRLGVVQTDDLTAS